MAMVEPGERFGGGTEDPDVRRRLAEERCLEAEQRCFRAERRRFEAERQRERLEELLAESRRAGLRMQQIVAELKRLVAELRGAAPAEAQQLDPTRATVRAHVQSAGTAATETNPARAVEPSGAGATAPAGEEMADALSAAIARLRAGVEAVGAPAPARPPVAPAPRPALAAARAPEPSLTRPAHKHSLSWIARWRIRRKQRRSR
jgi:hypothetical protein